ncbi:3-oxo-5-alpha-steroid 4-dehydrogenase 3 [Fistulifera solaris]|uniref:3-oxo-5-alpha-steroid 4-dehydrogenase 3 n=1 Tax=Fistulifera solaris TaxID=1519565 RepID=A0A1Z5JT41_FISSO|nr:3-oxo-5-alpha-steroid 4-dehydrogenase 3 [Fistulifera solaris]|eukprot:GAX17203.1 3-oxo-5-alpha-steroid 4-dehydrogenase 3 [Fistulifera solaris]
MHIMGYCAGVAHYIWLPLAFVSVPYGTKDVMDHNNTVPVDDARFLQMLVFLLGLWAQYQQHRHHRLLASLRIDPQTNSSHNSPKYRIPTGGWFRMVSCPHYLAEIILYVCFTILIQFDHPTPRMGLVLLFVVLNLSVTAIRTHRWYYENIPGYIQLQRRALIPFVL